MKDLYSTLKLVREGWRATKESWSLGHWIYWDYELKMVMLSYGEGEDTFEWNGFDEDFFKKEDWIIFE